MAKGENKTALEASKPCNRDTKCFKCQGFGYIASQCPNQRTMHIMPNGKILTNEEDDFEGMPSLVKTHVFIPIIIIFIIIYPSIG